MRIALKIELDSFSGARAIHAWRALLDRAGVRATFFCALGPDRGGVWSRLSPAALWGRTPLVRTMGADLRRLARDGHELGLAAWDAAGWRASAGLWSEEQVSTALEPALEAFHDALGFPARAFAAPGGVYTPRVLALQERLGLDYASHAHGTQPHLVALGQRTLGVLQVPGTLPRLAQLAGRDGLTEETALDLIARSLDPMRTNVYTARAELEGGPLAARFARFLARAAREGCFETLAQVAHRALAGSLPVCPPVQRTLIGFPAPVLVQGEAIRTSVRAAPLTVRIAA